MYGYSKLKKKIIVMGDACDEDHVFKLANMYAMKYYNLIDISDGMLLFYIAQAIMCLLKEPQWFHDKFLVDIMLGFGDSGWDQGEDEHVSFNELYSKKMHAYSRYKFGPARTLPQIQLEEEIFYLHDHVVLKSNGKIGIITKFINDTKYMVTMLGNVSKITLSDDLSKYSGKFSLKDAAYFQKIKETYFNRIATETAERLSNFFQDLNDYNVLEILLDVCIFLFRDPQFLKDPQKFIVFINNYTNLCRHDYVPHTLQMFINQNNETKNTKAKRQKKSKKKIHIKTR